MHAYKLSGDSENSINMNYMRHNKAAVQPNYSVMVNLNGGFNQCVG